MKSKLIIATDGACRGNPGPGSWAMAVFRGDNYIGKKSGFHPSTTNNAMELYAVVQAMSWCVDHGKTATILTDSNYCYKGVTEWLPGWKARGWKTSSGLVKNLHLWKQVDNLLAMGGSYITIKKVKGHSGDLYNDKADSLCNEELDKNLS